MIIYHASKKGFIDDVFNGRIADEIDQAFVTHLGRHTSSNEVRSWNNSMMHMSHVINSADIPDDSGIAIEYQIPLTAKRVDFIISGLDENRKGNIIIIELKQWEQAKLSHKSGNGNKPSYRTNRAMGTSQAIAQIGHRKHTLSAW